MMMIQEVAKCTTMSDSFPVPVTDSSTGPDRTKENLISIIDESNRKLQKCMAPERLPKPQICRVPRLPGDNQKNAKCFEPKVVAIGPYHRHNPHLWPAEEHKRTAAAKFTSGCCVHELYQEIQRDAANARKYYADRIELTEEEFVHMLFFDGCFVLHFIDCLVNKKMEELTMSTHLHGFIMGDMFLLENQLPFFVIQALGSVKPVKLDEFFENIMGTMKYPLSSFPRPPYHLLDLLRTKLLGPDDTAGRPKSGLGSADLHSIRSAKELREVGIRCRRSETSYLRDIKFIPRVVWGMLSLPRMVIDDQTRSRLLNMIALEMHLGGAADYGITSFVWFLDCLIDRAEDVRELREKGILLNALGSDEQVADLFNELATNLAPDFSAYGMVLQAISKHRQKRLNVSIYTFLETHFSTPWTAVAFIAAVFLLVLTMIQTYFAAFPRS